MTTTDLQKLVDEIIDEYGDIPIDFVQSGQYLEPPALELRFKASSPTSKVYMSPTRLTIITSFPGHEFRTKVKYYDAIDL